MRTDSPKSSVRNRLSGRFIARHASFNARVGSSIPSVVIGNVPKCMPMLWEGSEIKMRLDRLGRIHVNGTHEPPWLVRANREQRQVNWPEAPTKSWKRSP